MNTTLRISWMLAPNTFFVLTILSARSVIRPPMFWTGAKMIIKSGAKIIPKFKLLGPDWKGNHLWLIGNPCENNFSLFSLLLALDVGNDFLNNSHYLLLLRFLQFFCTGVSSGDDILWRWSCNNLETPFLNDPDACLRKRLCLASSFTSLRLLVCQVMLSHDSDQMSQNVLGVALWVCFQSGFVLTIVIIFWLVSLCLLIALNA